MEHNDTFVRLNDVSFMFKEQSVLNHVNLSIKKGTSYALIGKSGVGKSTLLNLISGFLQPNSGTVTIDGQSVSKTSQHIAFLFQRSWPVSMANGTGVRFNAPETKR